MQQIGDSNVSFVDMTNVSSHDLKGSFGDLNVSFEENVTVSFDVSRSLSQRSQDVDVRGREVENHSRLPHAARAVDGNEARPP